MSEKRYRAAWQARQEDGYVVTLHGLEHPTIEAAREDRDDVRRAEYVVEAWIEMSSWEVAEASV